MEEFKGKKLLILGATLMEIEIIKEARRMGIFTIVTDNHVDWADAPAKYVADEAWNISWSDMETLSLKCQENHVDGCIAGFSEKRIACAQNLCSILSLPFYADGAYLDVIIDKVKFKKACVDSNLIVPKSYSYADKKDYPVIVKPADNGGGRGVSICYTDVEFEEAYRKALDASISKNIVVEQYIVADETMVYFTVHNDDVTLSAMCDRYMHHFKNGLTQLPIGYFYPSKHLDILIDFNLNKYKTLIANLGIHNGLIAFQAFVVGRDVIPFDPTYRLDGTMAYHMIEAINGCNVLSMLIRYSLMGSMGDDENINKTECPRFNKIGFELPILLKDGKISNVMGLDVISLLKPVVHIAQIHNIGDVMLKTADFSQIFCRIHMVVDTIDDLKQCINEVYDLLRIEDNYGKDMIICKMDSNQIGC